MTTAFWGRVLPPPSTLQIRPASKGSLALLQERWFTTPMNWSITLGVNIRLNVFDFQIRKVVCSLLSRCIVCKKFHTKPIPQQMLPFRKSRMMAYQPLFSFSGIDIFGPLYVKLGGRTVKHWTLVVSVYLLGHTCYSSRVGPLNGHRWFYNVFLITSFINCRGKVVQLRCDRATTRPSTELWHVHTFLYPTVHFH